MQVFCDFDGTISTVDVTDAILSRFARPQWEDIEQEWKDGLIGSAECMQRQIALVEATQEALDAYLDTLSIDPGFAAFALYCRQCDIPLTVISDGVDYFISRILKRYELDYLPVIANKLAISGTNGHTAYALSSPYSAQDCASASGVCKCRWVNSFDMMRIYVGDGRSDFCVSNKTDVLFAKDKLAEYCRQNAIAFFHYRGFGDVLSAMRSLPELTPFLPHIAQYAVA